MANNHLCNRCGRKIITAWKFAKGYFYHPYCFTCAICSGTIQSELHLIRSNLKELYCQRCTETYFSHLNGQKGMIEVKTKDNMGITLTVPESANGSLLATRRSVIEIQMPSLPQPLSESIYQMNPSPISDSVQQVLGDMLISVPGPSKLVKEEEVRHDHPQAKENENCQLSSFENEKENPGKPQGQDQAGVKMKQSESRGARSRSSSKIPVPALIPAPGFNRGSSPSPRNTQQDSRNIYQYPYPMPSQPPHNNLPPRLASIVQKLKNSEFRNSYMKQKLVPRPSGTGKPTSVTRSRSLSTSNNKGHGQAAKRSMTPTPTRPPIYARSASSSRSDLTRTSIPQFVIAKPSQSSFQERSSGLRSPSSPSVTMNLTTLKMPNALRFNAHLARSKPYVQMSKPLIQDHFEVSQALRRYMLPQDILNEQDNNAMLERTANQGEYESSASFGIDENGNQLCPSDTTELTEESGSSSCTTESSQDGVLHNDSTRVSSASNCGSGVDCPICLEKLVQQKKNDNKDNVVTTCGHIFHSECINNWLNSDGNGRCPICAAVCLRESLIPVFIEPNVGETFDKQTRKVGIDGLRMMLLTLRTDYKNLKDKYETLQKEHKDCETKSSLVDSLKMAYEMECRTRGHLQSENKMLHQQLEELRKISRSVTQDDNNNTRHENPSNELPCMGCMYE